MPTMSSKTTRRRRDKDFNALIGSGDDLEGKESQRTRGLHPDADHRWQTMAAWKTLRIQSHVSCPTYRKPCARSDNKQTALCLRVTVPVLNAASRTCPKHNMRRMGRKVWSHAF